MVSNEINPGGVASNSATLTVIEFTPGARITDGLQVLYTFDEGSDTTVNDVSGAGTPLNFLSPAALLIGLPEDLPLRIPR
jgi:hypothetical protein